MKLDILTEVKQDMLDEKEQEIHDDIPRTFRFDYILVSN
jgi:hypothetical protein